MQLMRQSLLRPCCQGYVASRRCACWLTVVVILLVAFYSRYTARSGDDMRPGVDIDGFHENYADMATDDTQPDSDVEAFADSLARDTTPTRDEDGRGRDGQQDTAQQNKDLEDHDVTGQHRDSDDDRRQLEVDGRRSGKDKGADRDGDKADAEHRRPAAGEKDNDRDAVDRDEQNTDKVDPRGGDPDDDHEDGDGGKDAGREVGKDADGVKGGNADDAGENRIEDDTAVAGDSGKSYDTCDSECQRFRVELASWPSDKPKAFIYYLIYRPAMISVRKSIRALHRNFNRRFRYPIVVFVEPDMDNVADRRRIAEMVPTDGGPSSPSPSPSPPPSIYVQVVRFRIPDYVNSSLVPRMAGFGTRKRTIGYRHMCRFHAGGVYEQPLVRSPGLEYGWRLDDDSLITRPINYDLFRAMRDGGYLYGYRHINTGWSPVDYGLWDAVDRYLNATPSLTPTFYHQWPKNAARYFNNFELSALRVWLSSQYRDYFNFVDRLGGIYYYKWGDAAVKTIAVTLFVPRDRTHLFTGIVYTHMKMGRKQ